jgi:hypothetical protein
MTQCPQCGRPVDSATDFCGSCGYYVGWDKTMAGVNPVRPPPPVDPTVTPSLPPQEPRQPRQPDRPEPPPPPVTGPTVVCQACGDVNPDKRTYCQRCGERLPEPGSLGPPAAPLPPPSPYQPGPYPQQRPLNRKVLLTLLVAVLLIIVGVVFAATRGGDKPPAAGGSGSPTGGTTTEPSGTQTTEPANPTKIDPGTIDAEASSELPPTQGLTYGIGNTLDDNPSTAWNSNGEEVGTGAGQVLTYRFPDKVHLVRIDLVNGYAKSDKSFSQNGRIKAVAITTDAGTFEVTLADSKDPQNVQQDFGVTDSVSLRVISVYKGTAYPDLGLTEIAFQATPAG